jgi:hexosaminidase
MKFRFLGLCVFLSISVFAQQQFTIQPQQVIFNNQRFDLGKQNILGLVKQQLYAHVYDIDLGPEGYYLIVDSTHATLNATTATGLFYGIQTVKQLVKFDSTTQRYYIPGCTITDYPQYSYRGMHLDVCRHFFSKEVVKQYIDTLSRYRINYFHWHLTDDQGWRIEIKKYPKLTEVGAWRTEKDGSRYGGYYTQADVKEIVQYAAERHVTIIPEIEMPGHSSAAIAAYPWLSCNAENITVPNRWGIFKDIYCPTDSTFQFLRDVLDEVCALFPGPYIHIGGDEVPKDQWKKSAVVKNLMQREQLKNYEQVQHYFMRTMEQYLLTKGKRSMGWGEVTRGGMSDSLIVMSWRGKFAGIKAARQGNQVVMASRFYCYFDYPQTWKEKKAAWWMTRTTVKKVSNFNPKSVSLNEAQNKKIMGAEATLWTEYVADEKQLWHQLQPRLKVFSRVVWGSKP